MKTQPKTPAVIAVVVVLGFIACVFTVLWKGLPTGLSENTNLVIATLLGSFGGLATMVVGYYFGSSSSSHSKDETISNMLGNATITAPGSTGISTTDRSGEQAAPAAPGGAVA